MARFVKQYRRPVATFPGITQRPGWYQVFRDMLALFKSQASKDFDKAMDYLDCSRTLMSSAIETHRAIAENHSNDFDVLLELAAVVKPTDDFLKNNIETVNTKLASWKQYMQLEQPARYRRIERIVDNAEKNIRVAREKAIHIDHWLRFDMLVGVQFS
jgi:hypothetical protein